MMHRIYRILALVCMIGLVPASVNALAPVKIGGNPINVSVVASRTTGVAPLAVYFDASYTTSPAVTSNCTHECRFSWIFDDAGSGNWSNGTQQSRNVAEGHVSAHVYETPGTYVVTLTVFDGTNTQVVTAATITVDDPDVIYSGNNTVCIASASTPTAGAGGCPAGASVVNAADDFDVACQACVGTNKRCLFKRDDTFTSTTPCTITAAGPTTVGAYGTGAQPKINANNISGVLSITNANANDIRLTDIHVVGSASPNQGRSINVGVNVEYMLVWKITSEIAGFFATQGETYSTHAVIGEHNTIASGGNLGFVRLHRSAVLGGLYGGPVAPQEHSLRVQRCQRCLVAYNTMQDPEPTVNKSAFEFRAGPRVDGDPHPSFLHDSFYGYVGGNFIFANDDVASQTQAMNIKPSADGENGNIYGHVIEGNYFRSGLVSGGGTLTLKAHDIMLRNNIFDSTNAGAGVLVASQAEPTAGTPPPSNNTFLNNTCFSNGTVSNYRCIQLEGRVEFGFVPFSGTIIKNTLVYAPNDTNNDWLSSTTGVTGTIGAEGTEGNSSNVEIDTCPKWRDATCSQVASQPTHFQPLSGSYADGGGVAVPVWADFFGATRSGNHSGAVNP